MPTTKELEKQFEERLRRRRDVIAMYYTENLTMDQIAERLGMTRQRVQQIIKDEKRGPKKK